VRISIEILKTMGVVVVRERGYAERWKLWLNQIWRFKRGLTELSLSGQ